MRNTNTVEHVVARNAHGRTLSPMPTGPRLPFNRRRLAAVPALVAAAAAIAASPAAGAGPITRMPTLEAQVLVAINEVRQENGLSTLRAGTRLDAMAARHTVSMAELGYF